MLVFIVVNGYHELFIKQEDWKLVHWFALKISGLLSWFYCFFFKFQNTNHFKLIIIANTLSLLLRLLIKVTIPALKTKIYNLKFFLLLTALPFCFKVQAQKPLLEIRFTALNNTQYQMPDSIKIRNLTQGSDTVLFYPDTTLVLDYISSISENVAGNFLLSQNFPNPFENKTSINLYLPHDNKVSITLSNLMGKHLLEQAFCLSQGNHSFNFFAGTEKYYLLSLTSGLETETIKMIRDGNAINSSCGISYEGLSGNIEPYKSNQSKNPFVFAPGDELLYVAYSNSEESATLGAPTASSVVTFQFATNITCPGIPFIEYEGQSYTTIQMKSQCWLHENMNYETPDSWCFNNNPENCNAYGRMYLWESALTACPEGWHLPSDEEWKILESVGDSQYDVLDPVWNQSGGWRGYDVSPNLKSRTGWYPGSGNGLDLYGFTSLPGGYRFTSGWFVGRTSEQGYWCATEYDEELAWHRFTAFNFDGIYRFPFDKNFGFYVRCIKNH